MPEELTVSTAAESGGDPTAAKAGSEPRGLDASVTDRGPAAKAGQDGGKGSGSADEALTLDQWKERAVRAEKDREHLQTKFQDREKNRKTGVVRNGKPGVSEAGDSGGVQGKSMVGTPGKPQPESADDIETRVRSAILEDETEKSVREYGKAELGISYEETNKVLEQMAAYADDPANLDIADQAQLVRDVLAGRHQDVLIEKAYKAGETAGAKRERAKLMKLLPGGGGSDVPSAGDEGNSHLTPGQRQLMSTINRFSKQGT
jgi:hypothetical protein